PRDANGQRARQAEHGREGQGAAIGGDAGQRRGRHDAGQTSGDAQMRMRLAAGALLLPSCGSMDWMADPSGPDARDIATLTWVASLAILAVVLVVWVILAYLVAR